MLKTLVFLAISFGVCSYYLWLVRAGNGKFEWHGDQNGYYDLQGRAFASGQLQLPVDPPPEMLKLRDPWDPVENAPYRLHDAVLFNNRYYLYHGSGPALLLFAPWRLVTGSDMPQHFGLFLLIFGGYLFSAGTLLYLLGAADASPGPATLILLLITLGCGHSVLFLTSRVAVYEIAIASGYCFLAGAFFFLARAAAKNWSKASLAFAGLFFGLSIAGRPHLGLAACVTAIVFGVVALRRPHADTAETGRPAQILPSRQGVICCAAAFLVIAMAIAWHNWARFRNPFEFGHRYQLTYAVSHRQVTFTPHNAAVGSYFMLFAPPQFSGVFPWFRLYLRNPFGLDNYDWPDGYFIEPCGGVLFFAPLAFFAFFIPRKLPVAVRAVVLSVMFSAVAVYAFLTATSLMSERFQVDFLPWLLLVALFNASVLLRRSQGLWKRAGWCALALLAAWSFVANFALGITGPYDDMLTTRPESYLKIASWFTFDTRHLPLLNPEIAVDLRCQFETYGPGLREPLVTLGHFAHRYSLIVEHDKDKLRFVSQGAGSEDRSYEMAHPRDRMVAISLRYEPCAGRMTVSVDGLPAIQHDIKTVVTAPSQLVIGENRVDYFATYPKFTGKLEVLRADVRPNIVPCNHPPDVHTSLGRSVPGRGCATALQTSPCALAALDWVAD